MKFSVSSSDLLKQLQVAAGSIGSNPVLPILEDFLFSIADNRLTISATDLDTAITTHMDVMADTDGTVAVPAKILLDTLKALPQQPITFTIDENTFGIEITSAYGKYRLSGENGQDFPAIPEPESGDDTITLPSNALIQGVNKTLFATSNDELRMAMMGVYFQVDFSKITMVATDGNTKSGVEVATMIKSISLAVTPAASKARRAASVAKSLQPCSSAAKWRARMPVRSTIHSSEVSTPCCANSAANCSLVRRFSGK
jgi:DNA polymerase-3 subunit beta